MPKRYYKRRRRRYYKRKPNIYKLNRKVTNLAKAQELKYKDRILSQLTCDTQANGGDQQCLNITNQGDDVTHRTGNRIRMKRLHIKGYFDNTGGVAPENVVVRIMIFRCKFQNNSEQTTSLFFNDDNAITALMKMEHKNRYKVYLDHTFTMSAPDPDNSISGYIPFKFSTKLNSTTVYNGSAGTYADIERNGLWIWCMSTCSATDDAPDFVYHSRVTYYDS